MSIISTSCKVFSEAVNLGRHMSSPTKYLLAMAAGAASVQIAPIPAAFVVGATVCGAYYNAKKDIKLNMIHKATKDISGLVPTLNCITDQAKINTVEFKAVYENVKNFLPEIDERLDEQEAQLVQQGNFLQALKRYHDGGTLIGNNLKDLKEQENRLIVHINRLEELDNKKKKAIQNNTKQMIRWNNLIEKLKRCKGDDKREVVQEVCQEICNLTKEIYGEDALNKASTLHSQTTKVVEKDHRSDCQHRTEAAAKPTLQSKALNLIPLARERVSLNRQVG